MADLKTLLGDKYKEGMTIEEVMSLDIDVPEPDNSAYENLKKRFDEVASVAADYKKQLRASMSESEAKAQADKEEREALLKEVEQLRANEKISTSAKSLIAIGYDEELATEVATALYNGDSETVIKAQAKFVDAQKKAVLANAVKETPIPPASGDGGSEVTKEQFRKMTPLQRLEFSQNNPEKYQEIYGGKD